MSLAGYLVPNKPNRAKTGNGELVKGAKEPVLSGKLSPAERRYENSIQATTSSEEVFGAELPGGLKRDPRRLRCKDSFYNNVEDYDPVLLWHCQLVATQKKGTGGKQENRTEL